MDTGFAAADSRDDFARARRSYLWSRLNGRLRGRDSDLEVILPFDEVVAALGRRGERRLGERLIPIESIVGTVDRTTGFDRAFRPTTTVSRARFERIAEAMRRGEQVPAIDVYRVGEVHFVKDGHHRVAVARMLGRTHIPALVTEVLTEVGASTDLRLADLPHKGHERLFHERVPLPPALRGTIVLHDPNDYAMLAEGVEAWGFRAMQRRQELLDRAAAARLWYDEEYRPVVALLREAGLLAGTTDKDDGDEAAPPAGSDAEGYLRLAAERYRVLRSHDWSDEIIERLRSRR